MLTPEDSGSHHIVAGREGIPSDHVHSGVKLHADQLHRHGHAWAEIVHDIASSTL